MSGSSALTVRSLVLTHEVISQANGQPRDKSALLCAVRDWFLLAFSSQWVLSNQSSYGYSAAAWGFPSLTAGTPITITSGAGDCREGVWGGHVCGDQTC